MSAKRLLVSIVAIVSILLLVATVNAAPLASNPEVKVNGMNASTNTAAVVGGDKITVEVYFTAIVNDTDVTVEAELEGEKVIATAISRPFDIETGSRYGKTLTIEVPFELKDVVSDQLTMNIEIDGKEFKSELTAITLKVQRPSYNAEIKSVTTPQAVEAGETIPVDIVMKNRGYNDLSDLYVTALIAELGVKKTLYFGDLVAIENSTTDDEDTDTTSGRLYLEVPYGTASGVYTLELVVENDDTVTVAKKQIAIKNDYANSVIATSTSKTVNAGQEAVYELLVVNPTNKLKVYTIVTEANADLTSSADSAVIAVPAGSSKTVKITANAVNEGKYNFNVNVLSSDGLSSKVALSLNAEGKSSSVSSSPVIVLTVVLAVIFLVLLVVLIVLLGKKPQESEDSESYY